LIRGKKNNDAMDSSHSAGRISPAAQGFFVIPSIGGEISGCCREPING
jgi:hypothetical protein